jgi:site-specific recombinase XerD
MDQELADFLDYCRIERRLAPLTCSAYARDVGTCIVFLKREGLVTVDEVRAPHLRRFLVEESIARPAPSSQARAVAALKSFFAFLHENEQIERDPARLAHAQEARGTPGRTGPARARASPGCDSAGRRLEAQPRR